MTINFGKIKGFIVKFWQWHLDKDCEKGSLFRTARSEKEDFSEQRFKTSYENLDREMMSDPSSLPKRSKRSDSRIVYCVSERVVLFTFNKTDSRFVNASHFEITQLCEDSQTCQPDIGSQSKSRKKNPKVSDSKSCNNFLFSVFLTDLDQDGFQELISYTTTWHNKEACDDGDRLCLEEPRKTWQLVSKIRVVRLESELPKLYDGLTRP